MTQVQNYFLILYYLQHSSMLFFFLQNLLSYQICRFVWHVPLHCANMCQILTKHVQNCSCSILNNWDSTQIKCPRWLMADLLANVAVNVKDARQWLARPRPASSLATAWVQTSDMSQCYMGVWRPPAQQHTQLSNFGIDTYSLYSDSASTFSLLKVTSKSTL